MEQVLVILSKTLNLLGKAFLLYASGIFVFPLVSVYQEYKVWKPSCLPSLSPWGMLKVYLFNVIWMGACLVASVLCLPKYVLTGTVEYASFTWFERSIARFLVRLLVGTVDVKGIDKLTSSSSSSIPAPIYIANHSSQLDVAVVYDLDIRFKWISKSSVFYVPGAGQIMYLSGHVFINRKTGKNRSSVQSLYAKSNTAIQSGIPMFFFPQGTRCLAKRLPFKDGAFRVAMDNQTSLIPISIDIRTNAWNRAYPLPSSLSFLRGGRTTDASATNPVALTIHDAIPVTAETNKDELKQQCFDTIYSVLPTYSDGTKQD